jgi:predicted ester cyclase
MSIEEENKAVMRRVFTTLFDEKRLDRTDELFAPDYVDHGALAGQAPGLEGARWKWKASIAATPDLRVPIEDMLAEGDRVAIRWAWEGTQSGDLLGIPPTGRHFRIAGISIARLSGGKVVEQWEELDRFGLLQQLGLMPPESSATEEPHISGASESRPETTTSVEENKSIVLRFHDLVLSEGTMDVADELFTRDYIDHAPLPDQAPDLSGAKWKWVAVRAAIASLRVNTEDLVAEGDRVAARWTLEGTHQGDLLGIPPTGKRLHVGGLSIYRLAGGKIAEQWERGDKLGTLQQLGVIPAQPVTAAAAMR